MRTLRILVTVIGAALVVGVSIVSCGGTTAANALADASATDATSTNADGSTTGADGSGVLTPTDSGVNGANCPGAPPNNQAKCAAGDGTCTYPAGVVCECGGSPTNPVWTCTTCPVCPATQPTGTCTPGGQACAAVDRCTYNDTTECQCVAPAGGGPPAEGGASGATWTCGTCPGQEPSGTCTTLDLACDYGPTTCTCRREGANNEAWSCVTPPPPCPTAEPSPGASCVLGTGMGTGPGGGCTYGTATCRCFPAGGDAGDEWSCN